MGKELLLELKQQLGNACVFDMIEEGPRKGILWAATLIDASFDVRILVCGGDGSVGWVAHTIYHHALKYINAIPIAILPLGTGNDLARSWGWGASYKHHKIRLAKVLKRVKNAQIAYHDIWKLHVPEFGDGSEGEKSFIMLNYFSCGYDSQIAHAFHEKRRVEPELFSSQTVNKLWYLNLGVHASLGPEFPRIRDVIDVTSLDAKGSSHVKEIERERENPGAKGKGKEREQEISDVELHEMSELELEDEEVDSPSSLPSPIRRVDSSGAEKYMRIPKSVKALLFLNIPSYAGGSRPWGAHFPFPWSKSDQLMDDGRLEVVGFKGIKQQIAVAAKVAPSGMRLGHLYQASVSVRDIMAETGEDEPNPVFFQIDGEPWKQTVPTVMTIRHAGQLLRLQPVKS